MSGMYSDLLNVIRAKANRKAPNNVIWSECLRVIEELMAENKRLRDELEGLKPEKLKTKVMSEFCDKWCRFPLESMDEDELVELHCSECALVRLLNLGL